MITACIIIFLAYIVGAIPSGYLVARLRGIADIRSHGSGNIGATNVARALGIKYFFIVFLLDACKAYAFLTLLAGYTTDSNLLQCCALALIFGNGASIFLNMRGGKGIATACGIFLALAPAIFCFIFPLFMLVLIVTRTVGVASIVSLVALPLIVFFAQGSFAFGMVAIFISVWGLYLHRDNILALAGQSFNF